MNRKLTMIIVCVLAPAIFPSTPACARNISDIQRLTVPAEGIRQARFVDMTFADFVYSGKSGASDFNITFEKKVETGDQAEFDEIASRIYLDISTDGDILVIRLIHPKTNTGGLFKRLFDDREWKVEIEISVPQHLDIGLDADFSKVRISNTVGALDINSNFSDATVSDHTGKLEADVEFAGFRCNRLDGSFDVSASFGEVDLVLANLAGDSRASASFGSIDLRLPRGTGAVFNIDKSLGGISFHTRGSISSEGYKGSRRVLNDGGPAVDLSVDFGEITVRDNAEVSPGRAVSERRAGTVMPLVMDSWWSYSSNGAATTLRVESVKTDSGRKIARLTWDGYGAPFETVEVCETADGLCVYSVGGRFFGLNLAGEHRYLPPKLWLPYREGESTEADDLLGAVRTASTRRTVKTPAGTFYEVLHYDIELGDGKTAALDLAPGVGLIAVDEFKLTDYVIGGASRERIERTLPRPRFTEGVVTSITIRGVKLLEPGEVKAMLGIEEGGTYSREDIEEAVDNLDRHRFIDSASFSIDFEGNLSVRVYEPKIHEKDLGMTGSFSRIAGLGIGPTLTITSLIGPISEIKGGAEYHWGNREWTYFAGAEKKLFGDTLALGGSYRLAYESSMDWAIPRIDSYLNAFVLGLETNNFHQVEGATGYVRIKPVGGFALTGEYFEDEYDSVKKHTNWSFFNHRHKKDDNLPLAPLDEGKLVGVRATLRYEKGTRYTNTALVLQAERALDRANTIGEYTRLYGSLANGWDFPSDNYLKIRLAGGYSDDPLPGQKAFKLGGHNTLRGYDYETVPGGLPFAFQYGGNRMALCNVEYFLGDDDDFGMILFADAGKVWLDGQEAELKNIRRDLGVGITLGSDFFDGPLFPDLFDDEDLDDMDGLRINWAVPVGNVPHVSHWTVNFVRGF